MSIPSLHILHTESSCGWGGQEIRILTEAQGLIARGHQVALACPPQSRIHEEAGRYGVPVLDLPIARKNLTGLLAMRRLLQTLQPEVVNTHSSTDSWLVALACIGLKSAPAIVRTRHISSPIPDNFASRWLYARSARHVVTTGEALRCSLMAQFGLDSGQITSIPTGIDTNCFTPGDKGTARKELNLAPAPSYLGIVATLRSWKGHSYLIDAFASLSLPDWRLIIVGDGPQKENLAAQVERLGLWQQVILTGQQRNPERWLQALDIFCLPSYANEGVPQAILQAMLSGLPIVTTPVGAILEAVTHGETALVVPPKDTVALAGALSSLMHDPELRARMGAQSRVKALSRFSLDTMLDNMELVFRNTFDRSVGARVKIGLAGVPKRP